MIPNRFKIGPTYENEKGSFKVLEINGSSMVIEWDSGERIATDVAIQQKILTRMEKEASAPVDRKGTAFPIWMGRTFAGLLAGDFKDEVDGTHWRAREQLGGAVTRQLATPMPFNSWSIYHRPEVHWAAIDRYRSEDAWVQAKFFIRLLEDGAIYGFYIERSKFPEETRADWAAFLNWLMVEAHTAWLHQCMTDHGMSIFDPYPKSQSAFNRTIRPTQEGWLVEYPDTIPEFITTTGLAEHLAAIKQGDEWLNLMIGRKRPAHELLSSGIKVASEIASDFNLLMPLYLNEPIKAPPNSDCC